jgi:hypothetical protein
MTPATPAARRLSLLGCALLGAAALLLSGCGDGGNATAESAPTPPTQRSARAGASAGARCPAQLSAFVKSLDTLREQLAVGLSYDQYTARVKGLHTRYDKLPIDRLAFGCIASTGTPGERAFDRYTDAANAWGECLADASCDTAAIEPVLQRKWRIADHFLAEAE